VRCSSCEPLLDRYFEGTLKPPVMRAISAHLRSCPHCTALLDEVNVIDALLATTRATEPAPNFTFAIMAEVRSMPAPRKRHHPAPRLVALYIALAWAAAIIWFIASGVSPRAMGFALMHGAARLGSIFTSFAAGGAHALGHSTAALAAIGIVVLALDIAVAVGLARFALRESRS
jgi:anti-sigma factor RsiW